MSKCDQCSKEMNRAKGCSLKYDNFIDGRRVERQKYDGSHGPRCGDCGAMTGGYHHPGCDVEDCLCGANDGREHQAMGCVNLVCINETGAKMYYDVEAEVDKVWTEPLPLQDLDADYNKWLSQQPENVQIEHRIARDLEDKLRDACAAQGVPYPPPGLNVLH